MADKDLERITRNFVLEIGNRRLSEEQFRIYNAFVFRKRGVYKFCVDDKYGNTIRFLMHTNKRDDGVVHILKKHYDGKTGHVSAIEILKFLDVIRKGDLYANQNAITYTMLKEGKNYSLIIGLKKTGTEKNILKSFYSNK